MSEQDPREHSTAQGQADQTLLGVAPPRIDSSAVSSKRSPVFVRAGTSIADVEPAGTPLASPKHPASDSESHADSRAVRATSSSSLPTWFEQALARAKRRPVLTMLLVPVLAALGLAIFAGHHSSKEGRASQAKLARGSTPSAPASASPALDDPELEHRASGTLESDELLRVAKARAERKRAEASALREKLAREPAFADRALELQLLRWTDDDATALEAVGAMAQLQSPDGPDLLYEVWTGTSERTDTTELARSILYSSDVRSKASPALAVALELRAAESCEQYRAILPRALAHGDRRALQPLTKLSPRRGCGPKKNEDCWSCLRRDGDELSATISAVKSRRAPNFAK